jgi:hypothetical protein
VQIHLVKGFRGLGLRVQIHLVKGFRGLGLRAQIPVKSHIPEHTARILSTPSLQSIKRHTHTMMPRTHQTLKTGKNLQRAGNCKASLRLMQIVVVVPGEEVDEAGGREEWQARHLRRLMAVGKS